MNKNKQKYVGLSCM